MRKKRFISVFAIMILVAVVLAACGADDTDEPGSPDRPVPTPQPTATEAPEEDPTPSPEPSPTEEPVNGVNGEWFELLVTDKVYPEGHTGDQIFELAETDADFQELWERFQLDDEHDSPDVEWDRYTVLFVGTGESGGCPLFLDDVTFDQEEGFIAVKATKDLPEDAMCTMDWTPRVFVIALERDVLGEGELRAMIYDIDADPEIDPEDGVVVREATE
jgi:hypothetical protein